MNAAFPFLARSFSVGLAYFVAALVGIQMVAEANAVAYVWPAAGILLAVLAATPRSDWTAFTIGAFAGCFSAAMIAGYGPGLSICYSLVNIFESAFGAWLIRRLQPGRFRLDSPRDVLLLLGGGGTLASGVAALVTAMVVVANPLEPRFWTFAQAWWLADMVGIALLAPVILSWWPDPNRPSLAPRQWFEFLVLMAVLAILAWFAFETSPQDHFILLSMPYPELPIILLIALRTDLRGASLATLIVALIAAWGTANNRGIVTHFADSPEQRLLLIQAFLVTVALTSLILASTMQQRDQRQRDILTLNEGLHERIAAWEKARAELRLSEQRFRAIFDSTFQYIGLLDPSGTMLESNRTALQAANVTRDQVVGKKFWDLAWWTHDPELQRRLRDGIARAAQGEFIRFEATHPLPGGGRAVIDFSINPIRDESGQVVLLVPEGRDVTELKRTERALRASENLLRQFIARAPAAIAILDRDLRYLQTSDRWVQDYHLSDQPLIGRSHYEVFTDIPERWKEIHRRALQGSVESCDEDPFPRANGDIDWLQWELQPWYTAEGAIGGLIFFTQVITQRKRDEAALRESEVRFRSAFDHAAIGMALVSADGRWLEVNRSLCNIMGYSEAELLASNFQSITHPDDLQADLELVRQVLADECLSYQMEKRYFHKLGRIVYALLSVSLVRDTDDKPLYFISQIEDITERKQAENLLRENQQRLEIALENSRQGLWDWDILTGRVYINSLYAAILGYDPEETDRITDIESWRESVHPDDLPVVMEVLKQHLESSKALYHVDYRARRKDGSWVWVNTRGRAHLRDANGKAIRMMGTLVDISDRKDNEARLKQSVREKEVMVREIHHRVKNNLAVISSLFSLQASDSQDAALTAALREAQDRVRSMALVHEHLYSAANFLAVDFGKYAQALVTRIFQSYRLPDSAIAFSCDIESAPLTVEQAIPCALILNELISNCLKHAFPNGRSGKIFLLLRSEGGTCRFSVRDDGAGLPTDFDYRKAGSLGMRIIRTLVKQLDGTLEIEGTHPGTESRVVFPLPAA